MISKEKNKNKGGESKKRNPKTLDGALLKEMVNGGAAELLSNKEEVNRLNVFPVPDGDTGDNMFSTVDSGVKAIESLDTDNLAEVMRVLSHGMLLGARGNSGVILSQFFKGVADGFSSSKSADPKTLGSALELGVKEAYGTVMTPTEGTILTVAREAVERAVSKINPRTTIKSFFNDFVRELHEAVGRTPESLPALKEAGVVDSGGKGLFYLMDGFNRVLRSEKIHTKSDYLSDAKSGKGASADAAGIKSGEANAEFFSGSSSFDEYSDMEFSYCTELLVQLTRAKCEIEGFDTDTLFAFLSSVGDSVACVKSGSVVKIHVHTLFPHKVLAYMLDFGEFINVKIENMSLQHSELNTQKRQNEELSKETFANIELSGEHSQQIHTGSKINSPTAKTKKYGVVAVSNGNGTSELFKKLGADKMIDSKGGRNPSANDFLKSAEQVRAQHVFVFPNNKNFILAAEQAAKMENNFKIHVIPSRSIALGYASLSVINFDNESTEEILRAATKALNNASAGYVFTAARDTKSSGLKIKKGEFVGAKEKEILTKGKTRVECALKLCKKLTENKFVLTVFKGENGSDEEIAAIKKRIQKNCPEIEFYSIDSGQDVFDYIFLAE